jgi:hypothetical protein
MRYWESSLALLRIHLIGITNRRSAAGRRASLRITRIATPARSAATAGYLPSRAGANIFSPRSKTVGSRPSVVFQIKCRNFSFLLLNSISSASKLRQWQFWRTEICAAKIRIFSRISEKSAASAKYLKNPRRRIVLVNVLLQIGFSLPCRVHRSALRHLI